MTEGPVSYETDHKKLSTSLVFDVDFSFYDLLNLGKAVCKKSTIIDHKNLLLK